MEIKLTEYAKYLIAKHEHNAALLAAAEMTKENALREARRQAMGGVRKDLGGKVVATGDDGRVTRNRGVVACGSTAGMKVQDMLAPCDLKSPAATVYEGNRGCAVRKQVVAKAKELAPSNIEYSEQQLASHHKAKQEEHNAYLREMRARRKAVTANAPKTKANKDGIIDLIDAKWGE